MTPEPVVMSEEARRFLRHTVATLAYRAEKVLRDVPEGFADLRMSVASRTPLETLGHMCDLMVWGEQMARGTYKWDPVPPTTWDDTVTRFFSTLGAFDATLAAAAGPSYSAEVIFQGPVADALTHVGQLALVRGTVASPVRPESYARAEIAMGRVGREQSADRYEFEGDASKRRPARDTR